MQKLKLNPVPVLLGVLFCLSLVLCALITRCYSAAYVTRGEERYELVKLIDHVTLPKTFDTPRYKVISGHDGLKLVEIEGLSEDLAFMVQVTSSDGEKTFLTAYYSGKSKAK